MISLSLINCKDTKIKNDLIEKKINGEVKTITETAYSVVEKFGKVLKDTLYYKSVANFNEFGNTVERTSFNFDGEENYREVYKYNENNVVNEVKYYFSKIYNSKQTFEYDKKGNLILQNSFEGPKEQFTYRYVFENDEKNNLKKMSSYSSDGKLLSYRLYNNDLHPNTKIINSYNSNSILETIMINRFDRNENIIDIEELDKDSILFDRTNMEYDKNNNIVEYKSFSSFYESLTKYNYKYDKNKNWIEKIELKNNKAENIIERKIEYYKSIN